MSDTNELATTEKRVATIADLQVMAKSLGPLFKKSPENMFALMLIAQAEGLHPAIAAQEYDIIDGRPAINSRSALARFHRAGGKIKYVERTDAICTIDFSHPQGGEVAITWTIKMAEQAGLLGKDNWKKYKRAMLAARCIAEGIRACFPACLSGLYTVEEVQDFPEMRDANPQSNPDGMEKRAELITYLDSIKEQIPAEQLPMLKTKLKAARDDISALDELRALIDSMIDSEPVITPQELMNADDAEVNEIANEIFGDPKQPEIF
jgi:hypothetical protein